MMVGLLSPLEGRDRGMDREERKKKVTGGLRRFAISSWILSLLGTGLWTQFTPQEISEREKWESYLATADIIGYDSPWSDRQAVTKPMRLTLEREGLRRHAIWKNPSGRLRGYVEGWRWEIAAYRLDKHLGLNMIPPTVERRFRGERGSCQLMVESMSNLREMRRRNVKIPPDQLLVWNRNIYLQRAFDNLIANEDRHAGNYLITEDLRMILIDHSRTFRTSKKFTEKLIFTEQHEAGPMVMRQLPNAFFLKLAALNFDMIRSVVGEYLTDQEIEAVLKRKDLILEEINQRIIELGKDQVLY